MPPENSPATPPEPKQEPAPSPLKQIRTFQGDVAQALSTQKESLFSIRQTEQLKRGFSGFSADDAEAEGGQKLLLLLVGSLLLLAMAGFGGWYAYGEFVRKTTPPPVAVPESRFLSAESEGDLDISGLTRDTLIEAVTRASSGTEQGELRHMVLRDGSPAGEGETAPIASIAKFLSILESRAPGSLVRAFEPVFMLGTLGESRFLLLKLASFENAFGGMLNWEKDMASDIGTLFSAAELLKSIAPTSVFQDIVYQNKDVRALLAEEGGEATTTRPALLYSFFDNRMLIITDRLETLRTLIDRLNRNKLTR